MTKPMLFRRTSNVVSQVLAGNEGAVLLNLDTGEYHGLNPVGAKIWELLQSPRTAGDLVETISDEFQIESTVAEVDVREFLDGLGKRELVLKSEAP